MKKHLLYGGLVGLLLLGSVRSVYAGVPNLIYYQARLTQAGSPAEGNKSVCFKIFEAETGGTLIWAGTYTVQCSHGLFSVLLGSGTLCAAGTYVIQILGIGIESGLVKWWRSNHL